MSFKLVCKLGIDSLGLADQHSHVALGFQYVGCAGLLRLTDPKPQRAAGSRAFRGDQKMDFLSPSGANRDRDAREELEKKVAEQADQIKKLAEVASKYKMLVRENNMLKSSQKPNALTDEVQKLLGELLKKEDQIKSVKIEAKSAIDTLKAKHQVWCEFACKLKL